MSESAPLSPPSDEADTRARIISVATRRFGDRGYDATSLREIAEDLGITKAAVHYHFPSKEEILRAVLEPLDTLISRSFDVVDEVLDADDPLEVWKPALEAWVDAIVSVREQMAVVGRNRHTVAFSFWGYTEEDPKHQEEHRDLDRLWLNESIPLGDRLRMVSSLALITGFDDWAPSLLATLEADVLATELKAILSRIFERDPGS